MWPIRPVDEAAVRQLMDRANVSHVAARLLYLRGVRDRDACRRWLTPEFSDFHPPAELPDFRTAADRIEQAIRNREGILIWGHDDLDGITAVAVLVMVLSGLRARVEYHIPAKGSRRHGLDASVAARYGDQGFGLVVTVDCGITNRDAVAELGKHGMHVVITDHHEVLDFMPDAVANVDPKRPDSSYPYRGLAGVGVALKLAMGLVSEILDLSCPEFFSVLPDAVGLAVLGTIADRAPLTGENRTLVKLGMSRLENTSLPAVRLVLDHVQRTGRLTPATVVAELLPLFASAEGNEGVRNILDHDPGQAADWLNQLSQRAVEWRSEALRSLELAEKRVQVGDGIVLVRDRELSTRTLGYCATRLKERYRLPAIVMGWRGDAWVGECRSVEGINLIDLLQAHSRYFIDYGGHKAAAGFSVPDEHVAEFAASAEAYAHEYFAGRLPVEQGTVADARLPLAEFDPTLRLLAPFGDGNPAPLFVSEPVVVKPFGSGLVASTRQDLILKSACPDLVPDLGQVTLLYTIDDSGEPVILNFRPASASSLVSHA